MKTTIFLAVLNSVCTIAPLVAFIALIPFTGLFLGDEKEFKNKMWPLAMSIVLSVVCAIFALATNWVTGDAQYISLCMKVYVAASVISMFSACGLYLFYTDQYYVFEFILDYYIIGGLVSLKNILPKKISMSRTARVFISPSTWNQWFTELKTDSSLDTSYKPEQKVVEEKVLNE